ncbi:MAG: hypothetical protein LBJ33_11335 [Pseudomonas putida]|jgi:hypothetical protein|nr:hypothetical protein [Pseudomonas putida]
MGFRPIRQRLCDINLQAAGKLSCLALILGLGLGSTSHPAASPATRAVSHGTATPPFAAPLGSHTPVELRDVGFSGAVSLQDSPRWIF